MALTPLELSRELVLRSAERGASVTNLALQKLAYFAHGWHLAWTGEPLLVAPSQFCAWRYGPVLPESYHAFKWFGANPIPTDYIAQTVPGRLPDGNVNANVINNVLDAYRNLSAAQLVDISHDVNGPWYAVYHAPDGNDVISNDLIRNYFSQIGR